MANDTSRKTFAVFGHAAGIETARRIEAAGSECVIFPPLQINFVPGESVDVLGRLTAFDWILFTDVHAAESFIAGMRAREMDFGSVEDLRVAACGETVCDVLRFSGIHSDVVPLCDAPDIVFSALDDYLCGEWAGVRVLCAEGEAASVHDCASLVETAAAEFIRADFYSAAFPEGFGMSSRKTILLSGGIDVFAFSAPGDAVAYRMLAGNSIEGVAVVFSNEDGRRAASDTGMLVRPITTII